VHWKAIPLSEAAGTCKERGRGGEQNWSLFSA